MNDNTAENNTKLYREKTYDIASASEQITDRLRVTDPGVFIILCAVILLLAGVLVWSIVDTMEETSAAKVLVKNGEAVLVLGNAAEIKSGMTLRIGSGEYTVSSAGTDEFGRSTGYAKVSLSDGLYDGSLVTDTISPFAYLLRLR